MYFRFLIDETTGCVSYLLADSEQREAILIDPRNTDIAVWSSMLDEQHLALKWVFKTHRHPGEPNFDLTGFELGTNQVIEASSPIASCNQIILGKNPIQQIATPGHTMGCQSYFWRDRLFCGGVLAADACPHQAEPQSPAALWESATRKLFTLPNETLLFSGHSRGGRIVSTVMEQRSTHPWFAGASRDDFLSRFAPSMAVRSRPT